MHTVFVPKLSEVPIEGKGLKYGAPSHLFIELGLRLRNRWRCHLLGLWEWGLDEGLWHIRLFWLVQFLLLHPFGLRRNNFHLFFLLNRDGRLDEGRHLYWREYVLLRGLIFYRIKHGLNFLKKLWRLELFIHIGLRALLKAIAYGIGKRFAYLAILGRFFQLRYSARKVQPYLSPALSCCGWRLNLGELLVGRRYESLLVSSLLEVHLIGGIGEMLVWGSEADHYFAWLLIFLERVTCCLILGNHMMFKQCYLRVVSYLIKSCSSLGEVH